MFEEDYFSYTFYLVAPALGDYRYHLLKVLHSVELYPVTIYEVDEDILKELPTDMKVKDGELSADTQDTFMEILKAIFATKKVRKVIGAILAQSGVGIESK